MMGGALGGLEAMFLPNEGAGFWPLISMAAVLGGTMRAPFTSIVFAFELTHDANVLLPLLIGSAVAYGFTVLTLKRSILTEKVARRGFHLSSEYAVDPLELLYVWEVMQEDTMSVPSAALLRDVLGSPQLGRLQLQRLLPVVDAEGRLTGVLTSGDLHNWQKARDESQSRRPISELARPQSVNAYSNEPLRIVVNRMAENGITRLPVIDGETQKLVGLVTLEDLLKARTRHVEEERHREQVIRFPFSSAGKGFPSR
jgi:CBS domain-containing protein